MRRINGLGAMLGLSLGATIGMAVSGAPVSERRAVPPKTPVGPDDLPDRLCVDRDSDYFDPVFRRVQVHLNGRLMPGNVAEYCVSEGWLRTTDGRTQRGSVAPSLRPEVHRHRPTPGADLSGVAAERRARKAARRLAAAEKGGVVRG